MSAPIRDFPFGRKDAVLWQPGKLWSLADMRDFYMPHLLELTKEIGRLISHLETMEQGQIFKGSVKSNNKKVMKDHATSFEEIQLHMCQKQTMRIVDELDKGLKVKDFSKMLDNLYERIIDETTLVHFLCLSAREREFFLASTPVFGDEVQVKFPTASYEIEESSKCLALSRDTAAVFHLMRCMEIGIRAVAKSLAIPDPIKGGDRNWGEMLKKIKSAMDAKNATGPDHWKPDDRNIFESAYGSLDAVRVAWRNTTMHVENKYSPDEAEHIFGAVRGLMRRLASRMDENGQPLA
jgi:hypothetical protein